MSHDPGQPRPDADRLSVPGPGLQELEPRLLLSASVTDPFEPLVPAGASQDEVVALAAGDLTFGIDVSHWQGTINWNAVANDGIEFAFIKATQGVDFIDDRFFTNIVGAHNAGILAGAYHFATPYTGGINDAAAEASDFYDTISSYLTDGYLRPVLDLEGTNSLSVTVMSNWVHEFMNTFASLSDGIVPIIYTGSSYANNELNSSVAIYDLWYPRWPTEPDFENPPAAPGIWSSYDLWQYSDSESIAGISGDVDGDVFFGNVNELVAKYGIFTTPDDHGDDKTTATVVAAPSTTAGVITHALDSDWFKVTLDGNTSYTFSVLADGLGSAELRLYSSGGTLLMTDTGPASGGTLAELQFDAAVEDVYYLAVEASASGGYDLAVYPTDDYGDSIAAASNLTGTYAIGGLQSSTDKDYFHFTATAGTTYELNLIGTGLPTGVLTLYNSGGGIVRQDLGAAPSNPMVHIEWTAASDGEMYLAVSSNTGAMGDYVVTMSETIAQLIGDMDNDGFVGIGDLDIVLGHWNQNVTVGDWSQGDANGDGFVGIGDMDIVLGNWNAGTPPAAEQTSAEQAEAVVAAGATQLLGIDVSHWQGAINWTSVAGSGKQFAFIRALDRDGLLDTRFLYNIVQAKAAGIWAGAYQFVTPWTDGYNDAVEEATLFANTIAPYLTDGYLRPVIDIEAGPPHEPYPIDLDNTVLTNWVHDYIATFVSLTGVEPLIYTNTNHALHAFTTGINVYDLWLANWTNDPDSPPTGNADGVWNGYDFWQYSSTTSVPGIGGNVDGDVFFGDLNALIAEYGIVTVPDDHGNEQADATVVSVPSTTGGVITNLLDTDWFKVTLDGNTPYTFSVLADGLSSAELRLYSSGGTLLMSDTGPASGGTLAELQFTPSFGDVFYVQIDAAGSGGYDLVIQETDDYGDSIAQSADLTGGFALGGVQIDGDQDYFHFVAEAGKQYDFKAIDLGIPDAVLTLYDAGGAVVDQQAGSNPAGTHAQLIWTSASAADMYIAVSAGPGSLGDYALTLTVTDAPTPLDGDLNGDGFVGLADLDIVLGNWNQSVTPGSLPDGDPSGDGFVGLADLDTVLGNWNAGTPPVAQAAVSQVETTSASVSQSTAALAESSARTQTRVKRTQSAKREPAAMSPRTDPSRGLAIANWRSDARSAFGKNGKATYTPAIGLWEPDATA